MRRIITPFMNTSCAKRTRFMGIEQGLDAVVKIEFFMLCTSAAAYAYSKNARPAIAGGALLGALGGGYFCFIPGMLVGSLTGASVGLGMFLVTYGMLLVTYGMLTGTSAVIQGTSAVIQRICSSEDSVPKPKGGY